MDESMLPYGEPDRLYNSDDLLRGYDRDDPMAFAKSWDFQTYATYIVDGAATPRSLDIRLKQAGHDARIAETLKEFLNRETKPMLVGIMGGHAAKRKRPYQNVTNAIERARNRSKISESDRYPAAHNGQIR